MPKASRKGSFAVGEAGAKLARAFESEAANLSRSRLGINFTQIPQISQIYFGFRFRFLVFVFVILFPFSLNLSIQSVRSVVKESRIREFIRRLIPNS